MYIMTQSLELDGQCKTRSFLKGRLTMQFDTLSEVPRRYACSDCDACKKRGFNDERCCVNCHVCFADADDFQYRRFECNHVGCSRVTDAPSPYYMTHFGAMSPFCRLHIKLPCNQVRADGKTCKRLKERTDSTCRGCWAPTDPISNKRYPVVRTYKLRKRKTQ